MDLAQLSKVSDLKDLLCAELGIDESIRVLLKAQNKLIKTGAQLRRCCLKGAITVEFVERLTANHVIPEDDEYSDIEEEPHDLS